MNTSNPGAPQTNPTPGDRAGAPSAKSPRKPPRGWGPLRFILAYTRGLIVDQHLRRTTMFWVVIAAMLMAFSGDIVAGDWLDWHQHLGRFAIYWLICAWLTILAALLAVYDLLLLRVQHRLLKRELRTKMLGEDKKNGM